MTSSFGFLTGKRRSSSALMTVFPSLVGISGTTAGTQIRVAGAVHAGYSTITDYPLGTVKAIPYKVHLALDALGAVALAARRDHPADSRRSLA